MYVPYLRLGVNIDHVATLRNARGGHHPDPVQAAILAIRAGANGITAHLREDRRHIRDNDIHRLKAEITVPLNLEMAATEEMLEIALRVKPHACCLVPEKRMEVTTEGGLDVIAQKNTLIPYVQQLKEAGIRVSLFIDPNLEQVAAAAETGASVVEFHTGTYCHLTGSKQEQELERIRRAVAVAFEKGLECHAGHGLTYDNVGPIAAITQIVELNIGHFLMGEALFQGLDGSIRMMRKCMDAARRQAAA
jgi:pyridoxine 5-phosphate synthase